MTPRRAPIVYAAALLLVCSVGIGVRPAGAQPLREQWERARSLLRGRQLQAALAASESLLTGARKQLAASDTTLAAVLDVATACRYRIASYDSCDAYLRRALRIRETALGPSSAMLAPTLTELARIEKIRGRYTQGDTLVGRSLALLEAAGQDAGPEYARALTVQASLEGKRSRFVRARELCDRAIALLERHAGGRHPYLAESLYILGCIDFLEGRTEAAEATLTRCRELQSADPNAQASELSLTLGVLGDLQVRQARFDEAIATYQRALSAVELDLEPDHPDIGIALQRLGAVYDRLGQFELAVPRLERATAIHRKVMGDVHPLVASDLSRLGGAYAELGRYDAAQRCFEESIATLTQLVGTENPDVVYSVAGLAKIHLARGDYHHAEQLFERCTRQLQAAFGADSPKANQYLTDLAMVYEHQGRLTRSRQLYQQEVDRIVLQVGPRHPDLFSLLIDLAIVDKQLGRVDEADSLAALALEIGEQAFGPTSSNLIIALHERAQLLAGQGSTLEARALLTRARTICAQSLPPEHPHAASIESAWAEMDLAQGQMESAERAGRRATEVYTAALGDGHLLTLEAWSRLARILAARGDNEGSRRAFAQAVASRALFAERVFAHASEVQKARYVERVPPVDGALLSFALADGSQPTLRVALDMVLRAKGTVLEAAAWERAVAQCSGDAELQRVARQHAELCADIAAFSQRPWEHSAPQTHRSRMEALIAAKDSLEAQLSAGCHRLPPSIAAPGSGSRSQDRIDRLARALGPRRLLCELVQFQPYRFEGTGADQDRRGPARYAAITLDGHGRVRAVDLGLAAPLDSLVTEARQQLGRALTEAYSPLLPVLEQRLSEVTHPLYARLIAPIAPQLREGIELLVAPDGLTGLLPLEILPRPDGDYLIEHLSVGYLGSGRDLLTQADDPARIPGTTKAAEGKGLAVVVCDPQFDDRPPAGASLPATTAALVSDTRAASGDTVRARAPLNGDIESAGPCPSGRFAPLRFALAEGEAVAAALRRGGALQVQLWSGAEASESALKQLRTAPTILHLGTHGYFCPRPAPHAADPPHADPELPYGLRDPLLRAGLALAGANSARDDASDTRVDDGLLTAIEVATLDLVGTDLVTLSACDTGAGEVWSSEGVYGLRRAFQAAGARTLLMSQWPVPDRETFQLVSDFYERWLAGDSKRAALRGATLQALARARQERDCAHPVLWGAFMMVGAAD